MLTINLLRRRIPLTQGKAAIVDAADYEALSKFKWYAHKGTTTFYARRSSPRDPVTGRRKTIKMHAFLTGWPKTDHINHCGLDNQRVNLRPCTQQQNQMGQQKQAGCSSQHKGVTWHARDKRWQAYIRLNKKRIHLGYFACELDAARAYDAAAIRLFGDRAYINDV
jgi:hypothetical protein